MIRVKKERRRKGEWGSGGCVDDVEDEEFLYDDGGEEK